MPVKIEKEVEVLPVDRTALLKKSLELSDLDEDRRIWIDKLPIEIPSRQPCAVVADNNSIWVSHGNDLEDEAVAESFSVRSGRHQPVDKPLHHEGTIAFSRVDSGHYEDESFALYDFSQFEAGLLFSGIICDSQERQFEPS